MEIRYFFLAYFGSFIIAVLALGLRLFSRKAFLLIPMRVYVCVAIPLVLVELVSSFQTFGSFVFGVVLCTSLIVLITFLVGFWFIRRYANGVAVFNCEQKDLMEITARILQEQGLPFVRERTTFSINEGQSVIQFFKGIGYFSILNLRGEKSYFPPMLKKLGLFLQGRRVAKLSPLAFLTAFYSIFMLGLAAHFAFPNALSLDLSDYGEMISNIGTIGIGGYYTGGFLLALSLFLFSIRLFMPKVLILTTSTLRWIVIAFAVWISMLFAGFLSNYKLELLPIFWIIGLGALAIFWERQTRFYSISNLPPAIVIASLRDVLNSEQLAFEEVGDEFRLKSGTIFEVSASPVADSVSILVTGWAMEPKLRQIEILLFRDLKKKTGKASVQMALVCLAFSLIQLAYFAFPFFMNLIFTLSLRN